jgi:hypothetical protein
MQSLRFSSDIAYIIRKYRVHLFVFILALFIGLTLAHPAVFLNDEFITTNQLRQLHAGHQIIINEGKYGLGEYGNMSGYFGYKGNILAYTLFLPMVSLPAYWIIDITGEQFAYFIIVIWTITALVLLLFINHFFRKFSYIGRWQWTPIAVVITFLFFLINLFYYSTFSIDPVENYPEILAIVFTNIILLALSAMLMYEINRTIFEDPAFSFFGTMVCLFSSSYFLWSTFCKDHILVFACFVPIILCLVRFIKTDEYWYLPLAFLFSGLLAWARPEVALWTFILTCGICGYTFIRYRRPEQPGYHPLAVLCSPLFTLIGALPFFLNNLLITKNILLPVASLYIREGAVSHVVNTSQSLMPITEVTSLQSVIMTHLPGIPQSPFETISDLAGIFFYPQTGSISIFSLVPLFLVMVIIAGILLITKKIQFSPEEKKFIWLSLLLSLTVFLAYASMLHILNTDGGVIPDLRYLSPAYLPLTMVGLILLKKVNILPENPADSIKRLFLVCGVGLILSLVFLPRIYAPVILTNWSFPSLAKFFSLYVIAAGLLAAGTILYCVFIRKKTIICEYLVFLLCSLPFFWQVNAIWALRYYSGFAGYIFWIPVVRVFWELLGKLLFLKNIFS